ncbi:YqjF family protein [Virgibacillus ainsalahensis]
MYKDIRNRTQHRGIPLPDGPWIMTQKWDHLLFIHLPVPPEIMKKHIPQSVDLDIYDGMAWLTILPFKLNDMRFRKTPPIPFAKSFLELNVRTYVKRKGIPGIYFFSLDAEKIFAVAGGRIATLPYFHAKMKMKKSEDTFHYSSMRYGKSEAIFKGSYRPTSEAYYPKKGSLSHWLLERYYLYSYRNNALFQGGIHHRQWKIHDVEASITRQNLTPFLPDTVFNSKPLLHYAATRRVLLWPIRKVD